MRRKYLKGLYGVFVAILLSGCAGEIPEQETVGNFNAETEDYGDLSAEDLGEDSYFTYQISDTGELVLMENQIAAGKMDGSDEVDDDSVNNKEDVSKKEDSIQTDDNSVPGESVFTDVTIIENGFFSSAKLTREQMRAKNKELLMSVVSDSAVADELKQQAIDEIIALTARAECENAAEILLEAKGYNGVVVTMSETEVDVVVNAASITERQIAQIEDIVSRKTGIGVEGIVITAVIMEDESDEVDGDSFFSRKKLTREQMRAKNKELLMLVVDSAVSDELKQQAIDEIIALTARAECEKAAEILLEAKGYIGVVVALSESEVDVVVNAESLTEQQIAQIEDIVSRKTGIGADGIVITTVIMEE